MVLRVPSNPNSIISPRSVEILKGAYPLPCWIYTHPPNLPETRIIIRQNLQLSFPYLWNYCNKAWALSPCPLGLSVFSPSISFSDPRLAGVCSTINLPWFWLGPHLHGDWMAFHVTHAQGYSTNGVPESPWGAWSTMDGNLLLFWWWIPFHSLAASWWMQGMMM